MLTTATACTLAARRARRRSRCRGGRRRRPAATATGRLRPTVPAGPRRPRPSSRSIASVATNIYRGELTGGEVVANANRIARSRGAAGGGREPATAPRRIPRRARARLPPALAHRAPARARRRRPACSPTSAAPTCIAPVPGVLRQGGRDDRELRDVGAGRLGFTQARDARGRATRSAIYYQRQASSPRSARRFPTLAAEDRDADASGRSPTASSRLTYNAFPTGTLTAVILVPPPPAALAAQPCIAVRAAEIGRVRAAARRALPPARRELREVRRGRARRHRRAVVILRIGPRAIAGQRGARARR